MTGPTWPRFGNYLFVMKSHAGRPQLPEGFRQREERMMGKNGPRNVLGGF